MNNKTKEGFFNNPKGQKPLVWINPFNKQNGFYYIDWKLIKKYNLISGCRMEFSINKRQVKEIFSISGKPSEEFIKRKIFEELIATNPNEKFKFHESKYSSIRILDMMVPIGKGTRCLIVSPPRAGKTVLLQQFANEINRLHPEVRVIALLIDERPEEITDFKQNTNSIIFDSSMDKNSQSHVVLSDFLINHIKAEVESGNDIVVLIDSLTRMGRAYNNRTESNGRTMSGGLGSNALQLPRKLFGAARNIQNGGSCTIIATILHQTGSRMDEVIFQEFKGTGNSEIILDRNLADNRIFPAINLRESGTRKEELLRSSDEIDRINNLRRKILSGDKINGMQSLIDYVKKDISE